MIHDRRSRPDPYRLAAQALGVQPGAGDDDVKKAYRSTAQKFHPDRHAGEGKDAVYAARFNLATCAKTLLLARGSAEERKALDAFTKAKTDYDDELRKAGITPKPAAEAPRPTPGFRPGAQRASEQSRASARQAGTEKKWTPPNFDTGNQRWNGAFWETPKRPQGEQPRAQASSDRPQADQPRAQASSERPFNGPRAESGPRPEDVKPAPSSTARVTPEPAAPTPPQPPPSTDPRARAAHAAYQDAMSGWAAKGSRFERWA